ncbi:MAG: alpha/beta hydrolase [Pseudomonadota bacterium]
MDAPKDPTPETGPDSAHDPGLDPVLDPGLDPAPHRGAAGEARRIADWDDAYDNSGYVEGAATLLEGLMARSAAFRDTLGHRARLDIPYGPGPRQRFDLFSPEADAQGVIVFVHGGYWKSRDKSDWSCLAAGGLARGWAVAMPSYTLCPTATLADIRAEIVTAIYAAAAWVPGPVRLTGHSAGGHLVTRAICKDARLGMLPRVANVVSISGVHDLRPLTRTDMAATLRLDDETARAESPALLSPVEGIPVTAWVGADERPEFRRQAALLANIWTGMGVATRHFEAQDAHHFNIIAPLAEPDSALMNEILRSPPPPEARLPQARTPQAQTSQTQTSQVQTSQTQPTAAPGRSEDAGG